ncbi:hypothetical protein L195_g053599 [Trifolium pratense]|uniref:Uncharacterized protein n=1 Tax=Trifolium pratense TaxID=57577 RepID=A0A2K3KBK7_TRIPR|nr:hypothetical protein L195_g053599 [Trifolium pratense]
MLLVKEKYGIEACENDLRSGYSHIREAQQKRGGIAVDPSERVQCCSGRVRKVSNSRSRD